MNENVFLSLFYSFSRTQVREIRLRGSPRFRNKVEGEKRSPPLCPRPMEITFRLCDKFAADYSRIVMIPSMRVVPSFIASQKFCKKKKKLLYYYGYPRRSLRKRKREKKNREREKGTKRLERRRRGEGDYYQWQSVDNRYDRRVYIVTRRKRIGERERRTIAPFSSDRDR